jgi:hypothetical protein
MKNKFHHTNGAIFFDTPRSFSPFENRPDFANDRNNSRFAVFGMYAAKCERIPVRVTLGEACHFALSHAGRSREAREVVQIFWQVGDHRGELLLIGVAQSL